MAIKTFPYAVIYHGVFYPANTPIEESEAVVEEPENTESEAVVEEPKEVKPKGRKKNDN